ncbi:TPA: hypothetical protein OCF81_004083 [Escherichia coli]|uniref:Transposase n=1 Tax=Escherichia coli TaxID=562 RepID=A0A6D1P705_ECOLX|nr:hypothetical protein [Escherichia coli]HBK8476986.1 hypothetical protein [Salmonella enterica subsp. enterica serovar Heidelberg]HBN3440571.1 hypothetical protein [Escherichia coli O25b:H4-ST131]HCJ0639070.1 hypothetical protein [Salmonella enterica subsp. enterica serovar Infantis]EHJ8862076.1 hypothetical protein [Escherichia coli]EHK8956667.1 hypothetical protein [Escherichia coli]
MRTTKPGKMPGFFVSRSRANSMTIAERLEQKGRQEGRMEGALEKALAIACQLQKMGMTPEQIKQATGLSEAELKKIIH